MIASKAIDLIKTFSQDEFRKFGLFISSPYFNKENIQIRFYSLLKKYYPEFDNRNFEKEKVFVKLYPGKKYNDGVMRNILSGMLDLAENFLAIQHLQNKKFNYKLSLMKELSERKMEKLFEKAESEAEKILNGSIAKDEIYYYQSFELALEKKRYKEKLKSTLYSPDNLLQSMSDNLTISFLILMLGNNTYIANSNLKMFQFDPSPSLNELEIYLEKESGNYKDVTYIQYYYNAFKLARTQDEKYFYELKKLADTSYSLLLEKERRDIFTLLTNYCYYKINKGDLHFRKEHFLLHKENIERGYYKGERNFLSHIQYLNVVVTGLDAKEIKWVEEFAGNYKKDLDDVNRENTYNFCRALIYYHHKLYSNALDWAAKVKTDDLSYKHQLKSLYLKVYYDMNETEPFYSHIDSYRHFLMNQKNIPEVTRHVISSYVNFTKRLFDIKNKTAADSYDLFRLKKEITDNKSMINKIWLLDKINEIEINRG